MLMASENNTDLTDWEKYFYTTDDLLERGWTDAKIKRLLEPEVILYHKDHVHYAEDRNGLPKDINKVEKRLPKEPKPEHFKPGHLRPSK